MLQVLLEPSDLDDEFNRFSEDRKSPCSDIITIAST